MEAQVVLVQAPLVGATVIVQGKNLVPGFKVTIRKVVFNASNLPIFEGQEILLGEQKPALVDGTHVFGFSVECELA